MFWLRFGSPKSSLRGQELRLTRCVTGRAFGAHKRTCKRYIIMSSGLSMLLERDRETDHAVDKCVGIGGMR